MATVVLPPYRGEGRDASRIILVLIVSEGVTARMDSAVPANTPARRLEVRVSLPWGDGDDEGGSEGQLGARGGHGGSFGRVMWN